ncbi:MAG: carboxypeptidase-like regulatory domain-containing protein [Janthinobacterium lividum]
MFRYSLSLCGAFLLPGTYSITVMFLGFQQVGRASIRLQSQEHPLINIVLPIGQSDTTVTVTSEAPLLN